MRQLLFSHLLSNGSITVRMIRRVKIIHITTAKISAMGKANQTNSKRPVFASMYATGSNTRS